MAPKTQGGKFPPPEGRSDDPEGHAHKEFDVCPNCVGNKNKICLMYCGFSTVLFECKLDGQLRTPLLLSVSKGYIS